MTRYELHESLRLGDQAIAAARALGRPDLELRSRSPAGARCATRERADEAVLLLEPHAAGVRVDADVEQQWECSEASALALDFADRLGDAMPAWEAARRHGAAGGPARHAVEDDVERGVDAGQDRPGRAGRAARRAGARMACAANETVSMRVLQMQVTLAHRLRDVGHYGRALALLDKALAGCAASSPSRSDFALAEQRLVVLYQRSASRRARSTCSRPSARRARAASQ